MYEKLIGKVNNIIITEDNLKSITDFGFLDKTAQYYINQELCGIPISVDYYQQGDNKFVKSDSSILERKTTIEKNGIYSDEYIRTDYTLNEYRFGTIPEYFSMFLKDSNVDVSSIAEIRFIGKMYLNNERIPYLDKFFCYSYISKHPDKLLDENGIYKNKIKYLEFVPEYIFIKTAGDSNFSSPICFQTMGNILVDFKSYIRVEYESLVSYIDKISDNGSLPPNSKIVFYNSRFPKASSVDKFKSLINKIEEANRRFYKIPIQGVRLQTDAGLNFVIPFVL